MNDVNLEEALASSLARHAERAPRPPADLSRQVAVKHRRRRVTRVTSAATSVALAVAALTFGIQGLAREDRDPSLINPAVVTPKSKPIEKQWPGAVQQIPAKLPDGTRFTPVDYVNDTTLVIATWRSSSVASALFTYDLTTHRTVKLAFPVQSPKVTATHDFTVGSGRVGWLSKSKNSTEIWTAPVSGGPAAKLYTGPVFPAADVSSLTLTGDSAYWSLTTGGVFRAALAGGAAQKLPGTDRMRLMSWPWAGGPAYDDGGSAMAADAPLQVAYKDIRNLVTGERRSFTPEVKRRWTCAVTWCVDERRASSRDGRRIVRPSSGHIFNGTAWGPALDRFVTMHGDGPSMSETSQQTLIDLETGKGGTFSLRRGDGAPLLDGGRLHYYARGTSYLLVDLSKIS
ncbi:hypothetical protein [Actinomadura rudentiformis]|uniref:WD40 repeat domain-containing protein n=1 Tax=Actinomadura rudentiformis TaxID=359158 RepID=A0A6H9YWP5_9ACTN|nr:hypothetical protein [Actinomadura rudentiformis]KAB2348411.1 hypothetical protein F8566_16625 [Actinomadura rudentiformis]